METMKKWLAALVVILSLCIVGGSAIADGGRHCLIGEKLKQFAQSKKDKPQLFLPELDRGMKSSDWW